MKTSNLCFFETAGELEVSGLLSEWQSGYPEMGILALVAESDRETCVPVLQALCSRMNVPLCGAVFPALLFQKRFHAKGCVLARFDSMPFARLYGPLKPAHPQTSEIIESMAQDITGRLDRPRSGSLFMIFDQMVVNIATVLDELYLKLADRVHYLGVNAGSETFKPMPCLFDNARLVQDGALLMLLPDHPGAVVEHCYAAPERMISATSTEGNRIITIDWRPAFEVYREMMEAEYGVKIDRGNFYQYAVHFPFGIVRSNNEILVRIPVALEPDGSLFCVGEVPPNALLTLLRAPAADSLQTVDAVERGRAACTATSRPRPSLPSTAPAGGCTSASRRSSNSWNCKSAWARPSSPAPSRSARSARRVSGAIPCSITARSCAAAGAGHEP